MRIFIFLLLAIIFYIVGKIINIKYFGGDPFSAISIIYLSIFLGFTLAYGLYCHLFNKHFKDF